MKVPFLPLHAINFPLHRERKNGHGAMHTFEKQTTNPGLRALGKGVMLLLLMMMYMLFF